MKKFETEKTYKGKFIGDSNLSFQGTVLKRTEKTITMKVDSVKEPVRLKIHNRDEIEFVYPLGRHSMAPVIKASSITKQDFYG